MGGPLGITKSCVCVCVCLIAALVEKEDAPDAIHPQIHQLHPSPAS
jgi:hypothetical protein